MFKKLSPSLVLLAVVNLIFIGSVWAQNDSSLDGVWRRIDDSAFAQRQSVERLIIPTRYETFRLNETALNKILESAPQEFSAAARSTETILTIPMPDGGFERFRIENSPIMEPGLAVKYPEIQSFRGSGLDNPTATVRFDVSPSGFHAQILSNRGTVLIEPYAKGDTTNYISFYKNDVPRSGDPFVCLTGGELIPEPERLDFLAPMVPTVSNGTQLRIYRLALAATGEYTSVFRQPGDDDAQAKARALAAMNTAMNRVNGVYERDLSLRMVLVANNDLIIYTDGATDPYTNNNGSTMLSQNTTTLNNVIGSANYDIGHVFSTGGGGVATLNGPCGGNKARGVTGLSNPVGDVFYIDYVAHEMGHQFGSNHTFNGTVSNCGGGNRSASNAYEPGSGITIMGYAGICGAQDLARNSIDSFHVRSLEAIVSFINGAGNCSVNTPTGNSIPTVTSVGGTSWNIPKQTPFVLTASATDTDGDTITYDWHEYDLGSGTSSVPNTDADGARPIFRSYSPTTSGTRYFPSLQYILNNANVPPATYNCGRATPCMTGEILPSISRTMNFQVIARDNRAGGGAINTTTVQVIVDGNSGPFSVSAPNTAVKWTGGSQQTVTWDVANTNTAPVNATNVKISLSTDGGLTFPITLLESTANDGSETITVPNVNTTQARIKIEAVGNIFFDISDENFTITDGTASARKAFDFDGDGKDDIGVFRSSNGIWYLNRSTDGFIATQFGLSTDKAVVADYDGDGKADVAVFRDGNWYWLNSSNGAFNVVQFGTAGDQPVTGDFDGDGKADQTVYRNGMWFIRRSSDEAMIAEQFGLAGDKPLVGDFDGDGKSDIAVFRPSDETWYLFRSQEGFSATKFGLSSDALVPADYDGDGKTDLAVFRNGTWYLLGSQAGLTIIQFGIAGDIPTPADYDGDGSADISVFRPSDGVWYQQRSQSGFTAIQFGTNGDTPVEAPLY